MKIYVIYDNSGTTPTRDLLSVVSSNSAPSTTYAVIELTEDVLGDLSLEQVLKNITNLKLNTSNVIMLQSGKSLTDMKLATLNTEFSSAINRANTTDLFNWL